MKSFLTKGHHGLVSQQRPPEATDVPSWRKHSEQDECGSVEQRHAAEVLVEFSLADFLAGSRVIDSTALTPALTTLHLSAMIQQLCCPACRAHTRAQTNRVMMTEERPSGKTKQQEIKR